MVSQTSVVKAFTRTWDTKSWEGSVNVEFIDQVVSVFDVWSVNMIVRQPTEISKRVMSWIRLQDLDV